MSQISDRVQLIKEAFESGYSNAASSLSLLANKKFTYEGSYQSSYALDTIDMDQLDTEYFNESGELTLLTTEVFGDVHGKSYLFLSAQDYEVLTKNIPQSNNPAINFHHEFLKEVDNIISAAVITKLSNQLKLKMYGDVPMWVGAVKADIEKIISNDFQDRSMEIHVSNIYFKCDGVPAVRPHFIWVMDSKLTDKLVEKVVIQN